MVYEVDKEIDKVDETIEVEGLIEVDDIIELWDNWYRWGARDMCLLANKFRHCKHTILLSDTFRHI